MQLLHQSFEYACYEDSSELAGSDAALLEEARRATKTAYAPYSGFRVGAALRLEGDILITGSNQENAAFPAGLCAERVALAAASSRYPGVPVLDLAVSYDDCKGKSDSPVSPCGICRQSLVEQEERFGRPVRLILGGLSGRVYVVESASFLMPLAFSSADFAG